MNNKNKEELKSALSDCAKAFKERAEFFEKLAKDYEKVVLKPLKDIADSRSSIKKIP